jgi:integral membrane protein (TIGR01906 family)
VARGTSILVGVATGLVIVGAAVAVLLTPPYTHAALRSAGSGALLGVSEARAEALSDRTIGEMVAGPATFAFPIEDGGARFYDEAEASHLRDARTVLYGFVLLVGIAAVALIAAWRRVPALTFRRAVAAGGATLALAFAAIGLALVVAFPLAFELFHRVFFPGGNWQFDVGTERMVQLYPTPFWEMTATTLAILVIGAGGIVWFVARRSGRGLRAAGPVGDRPDPRAGSRGRTDAPVGADDRT